LHNGAAFIGSPCTCAELLINGWKCFAVLRSFAPTDRRMTCHQEVAIIFVVF